MFMGHQPETSLVSLNDFITNNTYRWYNMLHTIERHPLQHTATHCKSVQLSATQSLRANRRSFAIACNTLQHTAITATRCSTATTRTCKKSFATHCNTVQLTASHYSTLQHTATHCNTLCNSLHHTTAHCNTNATHCNTLQHTATHCNTLQHTATHCATHCITLQHAATHCTTLQRSHYTIFFGNILQYAATHCNSLQHTTIQALHADGRNPRDRTWCDQQAGMSMLGHVRTKLVTKIMYMYVWLHIVIGDFNI